MDLRSKKTPNFFSTNSLWFKFSDYKLIKTAAAGYYISPVHSWKVDYYQPFEKYPDILKDFFELHLALKTLNADTRKDQGELILGFVKKYGLFGILWNKIDGFDFENNKISLKKSELRMQAAFNQIFSAFNKVDKKNGADEEKVALKVDYESFVEHYLPSISPPYPNLMLDREKFYRYYSESVFDVYMSIKIIGQYLDIWRNYEVGKETPQEGDRHLSLEHFAHSIWLEYSNDHWQIKWAFNSLFDGLALMYVLNFVDNIGNQSVKVCQNKSCNKPFIVGGENGKKRGAKWCSEDCGNAARVARHRKKKKDE